MAHQQLSDFARPRLTLDPILILTLLTTLLPTFTSAACNTLHPTSTATTSFDISQSRRVSKGIACTPATAKSGGLCTGFSYSACAVVPRGQVTVVGRSNLTEIDDTQDAWLFELASAAARAQGGDYDIVSERSGCLIPAYERIECLKAGESGYVRWVPGLVCIDGVLRGCDGRDSQGGPPVRSGTNVRICGPSTLDEARPAGYMELVRTSSAVARGLRATGDIANRTCARRAEKARNRLYGSGTDALVAQGLDHRSLAGVLFLGLAMVFFCVY